MSVQEVDDDREADPTRRRFLTGTVAVVGGVGVGLSAIPFLSSFQPSARARAVGAPVEADISKIEPGQRVTFKWRGQPVWVVRRTPEMLATLENSQGLSDPDSAASVQPAYATNTARSINPEYLVLIGICTHLGCSPTDKLQAGADSGLGDDWPGGFFCPCHGSKFDLAGRVFRDVPAPTNLVVPRYQFLTDTRLLIGEDSKGA
jgi:ubiquinol-cytochrome c reductase iron-sulfur subunit